MLDSLVKLVQLVLVLVYGRAVFVIYLLGDGIGGQTYLGCWMKNYAVTVIGLKHGSMHPSYK